MKAYTILILVISMVFTNCSGAAEELPFADPENFENILGKWYPSETISKGLNYPYIQLEECGKDFLDFKREGIMQSIKILDCRELIDNFGSFMVVGYFLSIEYRGKETVQFGIAKLDAETLELIYIDHLDGNGVVEERRIYLRD